MAADYFAQTPLQGIEVEDSEEPPRNRNVVCDIRRPELREKPQLLLRKRHLDRVRRLPRLNRRVGRSPQFSEDTFECVSAAMSLGHGHRMPGISACGESGALRASQSAREYPGNAQPLVQ